jgi:hypothetical protein
MGHPYSALLIAAEVMLIGAATVAVVVTFRWLLIRWDERRARHGTRCAGSGTHTEQTLRQARALLSRVDVDTQRLGRQLGAHK